jgi:23S rRNA pseudouridine2605 synthase
MRVDPKSDDIQVDGVRIGPSEEKVYVALNKPIGVLSSLKSQGGKKTLLDLVDIPQRVYPVGRLDMESEGLILLTNDGDLTYRLTHPRFGHEKEYRVLLNQQPNKSKLSEWRRGVVLADGVKTHPAECWLEPNQDEPWLRVVIRQGRKRQIRQMAEALGLRVHRLIRIRIDGLDLGDLEVGDWRKLEQNEIQGLRKAIYGEDHQRSKKDPQNPKIPSSQQPRSGSSRANEVS